jgi:hypothetical protein
MWQFFNIKIICSVLHLFRKFNYRHESYVERVREKISSDYFKTLFSNLYVLKKKAKFLINHFNIFSKTNDAQAPNVCPN